MCIYIEEVESERGSEERSGGAEKERAEARGGAVCLCAWAMTQY